MQSKAIGKWYEDCGKTSGEANKNVKNLGRYAI